MSTLARLMECELRLELYRKTVERYLGECLTLASEADVERFHAHCERCFDWGINGSACARTWLAKVGGSGR